MYIWKSFLSYFYKIWMKDSEIKELEIIEYQEQVNSEFEEIPL